MRTLSNSYPVSVLKKPSVTYVLNNTVVTESAVVTYVGPVGLNYATFLGTVRFDEEQPTPYNVDEDVLSGQLLLLRSGTLLGGNVSVAPGGEVRILDN